MNKLYNFSLEPNGSKSTRPTNAIRCQINYGATKSVSEKDINNYETVLGKLITISINDLLPSPSKNNVQNEQDNMKRLSKEVLGKFKDSFRDFWFEKSDISVYNSISKNNIDTRLIDSIYHRAEMLHLKIKLFDTIETLKLDKQVKTELYEKYEEKIDNVYSHYEENYEEKSIQMNTLERIYNLYPNFLIEISKI